MAPGTAAARQEAAAARWEVQLAKSAVSQLNGQVPPQLKPEVEEALAARLQREKSAKSLAADRWQEHARASVQKLLAEVLQHARRKDELAGFFRENNCKALAYAESILGNVAAAQDALSQTYIELLGGKTTRAHFFRALKGNARNRRRRLSWEVERFERVENVFNPRHQPGEDMMSGGQSEEFSLEPASSRFEDQDPLDQLLLREEQEERSAMVQAALHDPRWRYCKRWKWARPLLADVRK